MTAPVLIGGEWRESCGATTFDAVNPATGEKLGSYPISEWAELDEALDAGREAYYAIGHAGPEKMADFLERFAARLEAASGELAEAANAETALPASPRLRDVELPRTCGQLRQAAAAAREHSWRHVVVSPEEKIASMYAPLPGPVAVFGPNNFPYAFNGASGGDAAAAFATGHPVIAKANPGHPGTTRVLAREGQLAAAEAGLPAATLQLVYRTSHADGARLVSDPRIAATGYTGGRTAGLALKEAADKAGKPIYMELSSVNPVVVLPGAWAQRGEELAAELVSSMLMGVGQFCTSPGILFSTDEGLRDALAAKLDAAERGTLLGPASVKGLESASRKLIAAGARVVVSGGGQGVGCTFPNTLFEVDGAQFLKQPEALQTEAFGNASLFVWCASVDEIVACLHELEGNLTGCVYSAVDGSDDAAYRQVEPPLRERVGRLLNDKVPTGVAVVPAMNHGGPYPATGHPVFTAVGIPRSLLRFCALQCWDNVRDDRLPDELKASNPLRIERLVAGRHTTEAFAWG